jgi:hypothetical protein
MRVGAPAIALRPIDGFGRAISGPCHLRTSILQMWQYVFLVAK